jgi:hypothetical protein
METRYESVWNGRDPSWCTGRQSPRSRRSTARAAGASSTLARASSATGPRICRPAAGRPAGRVRAKRACRGGLSRASRSAPGAGPRSRAWNGRRRERLVRGRRCLSLHGPLPEGSERQRCEPCSQRMQDHHASWAGCAGWPMACMAGAADPPGAVPPSGRLTARCSECLEKGAKWVERRGTALGSLD